ncbi:HAMP domain-containing histidine kinase [Streptomyces sp. A7024]|uniref:histidine kinase n=1 Tax=Streptomyces coryli TaxID=1128680 RepID=A0A6G4UBG0_9ACTN|nr:HAMP domain-containing sensor histidine kinase [Streptomyces coryli]NGN69559.1 HAMP domain-containing histidine kinase [Streptomyces coryli]
MRRQLLLLTAATTALVLVALLVPLGLLARSQAANRATADAAQRAQSIAAVTGQALARGGGGVRTVEPVLAGANGAGLPRTSVFLPDGDVLGAAAPVTRAVKLARTGKAFTYEPDGGGRMVLVPVQGVERTAVVQVAVSEGQLYDGTLASWLGLAGLGAGLMLVGLLVADRLAARLVGATRRLAGVADRLAGGDLSARAEPAGPPELRLVAGELNNLAGRIDGFLTVERENAADLAHRLRTPLAALRLDAEGLRDAREAERIAAGVAGLERGVDDVIRAARRPLREGEARSDLAAVARERVAFWAPLAEDQGRAVVVAVPEAAVPVPVEEGELGAVLDALIGNVLDHTAAGVGLRVAVTAGGELVVADGGEGFAEATAGERGVSGDGSTGLGLDIARRTAEESGGEVTLGRAAEGGALVTIRFGDGIASQ